MSSSSITKIFQPSRLFLGIGVAAAGAVVLAAVLLLLHSGSLALLAAGPLLMLIGGGIAASSNAEACAACREVLADTYTIVPFDLDTQARAAVRAAAVDGAEGVVHFERAPLPPPNAPVTSSFELSYCPKCQHVGRLSNATRKALPDGATTTHDHSPPVDLSGPAVSRVVAMVTARNAAWQQSVYGGVLPS